MIEMTPDTKGITLDTEIYAGTTIQDIQTRVYAALKRGYNYSGIIEESEDFLGRHVSRRFNSAILYIDLVGSTQLALDQAPANIIPIMSTFVQEMGIIVVKNHGLVLKFMGDAVIGYFVSKRSSVRQSVDDAVTCAKTMLPVIKWGINPVLTQYDFPELQVKIGIDYGLNIVIQYGKGERRHLDMMGRSMNMAAKIEARAKPDQILLGMDVYNRLRPDLQKEFMLAPWSKNWSYRAVSTGDSYMVYEYDMDSSHHCRTCH